METDSKGNQYQEVLLSSGGADHVRLTYVQKGWDNKPSVRIQIRDESGRLWQGPEIPITSIGNVVGGVVKLLAEKQ